jgi:hypothetical protein
MQLLTPPFHQLIAQRMLLIKNILINWKICSIQQQIKRRQLQRQEVRELRAKIAQLNRKKGPKLTTV